MEDELRATREKVKTEEVRSVNKGKAKFKRLLLKAYKAELKHRLNQWKIRVDNQNYAGDKLQKQLLLRMKNRIIKQAFDRFISGAKRLRQMDRNQDRSSYLREKLEQKRIRKVFNYFCSNVKHQ